MQKTKVWSMGQEDALEKEMATHSSILAWRVPWTEEPAAASAVKLLQSCPTLCDPIDSSPPGSPVPGILQARTLEWVDISFCNAWKWKMKVKSLCRVRFFVISWTAAYQAPPSMRFFQATVLEWGAITFSVEEPSGLQSPWGHKELDMTERLNNSSKHHLDSQRL